MSNDNFSNDKEAFQAVADKILLKIESVPKKICQTTQPEIDNLGVAQLIKIILSYNSAIKDVANCHKNSCDTCEYKNDRNKNYQI